MRRIVGKNIRMSISRTTRWRKDRTRLGTRGCEMIERGYQVREGDVMYWYVNENWNEEERIARQTIGVGIGVDFIRSYVLRRFQRDSIPTSMSCGERWRVLGETLSSRTPALRRSCGRIDNVSPPCVRRLQKRLFSNIFCSRRTKADALLAIISHLTEALLDVRDCV
jgi:hypothetical protein